MLSFQSPALLSLPFMPAPAHAPQPPLVVFCPTNSMFLRAQVGLGGSLSLSLLLSHSLYNKIHSAYTCSHGSSPPALLGMCRLARVAALQASHLSCHCPHPKTHQHTSSTALILSLGLLQQTKGYRDLCLPQHHWPVSPEHTCLTGKTGLTMLLFWESLVSVGVESPTFLKHKGCWKKDSLHYSCSLN